MKLAKLFALTPLFLTVVAQDLSIAGVKQAFNKADVSRSFSITSSVASTQPI